MQLDVQLPGRHVSFLWGTAGDIPIVADYNKNSFADLGIWRPSNGSWYVHDWALGATLVNGVAWGQFGDCPIAARLDGHGPGVMQLNVWRPSNGVWYYGRSFAGTGGLTFPLGTYGDIPFGPDIDGDGDGDLVMFRPSTGTWYGESPDFSIAWGQPGDIPAPRSVLTGGPVQSSALSVYRPSNGMTYDCFTPTGSGCTTTSTDGPSGSPGVVPIQGRWK